MKYATTDWVSIPTITHRKQVALAIVDSVISGLIMLLFFVMVCGILVLIR